MHRILAQPFLPKAKVGGKIRKHVPDYIRATDHGPVVIDVKPEHLLTKPVVAYTFAWTRRLVEARGWQYEVWIGAPSPELENLRFLAGYRRPWLFDAALLDQVRSADVAGRTFEEVVRGLDGYDPAAARAAAPRGCGLDIVEIPSYQHLQARGNVNEPVDVLPPVA